MDLLSSGPVRPRRAARLWRRRGVRVGAAVLAAVAALALLRLTVDRPRSTVDRPSAATAAPPPAPPSFDGCPAGR